MKVQHVYCGKQHWSAIAPVCDELRRRGHEVVEVSVYQGKVNERKPGFENVDVEGSDIFLCSFPHILSNETSMYEKDYGIKICIEHGVNPVAWAFPLERHGLFDHLFLAGRWQQDAIRRSGWGNDLLSKSIVTGWPKADALIGCNEETRKIARAELEKKMNQPFKDGPIVAWVPTHGGAWPRTNEIVRRMPKGVNLVIAPHEGKYAAFRDGRLEKNYATDYPHYIETPNIYEVLKAADVVISDYSSAMLEAAVLGVPIIQILEHVQLHNRKNFDPYMAGYYALSQNDKREFKLGANVADLKGLTEEVEKAVSMKGDYWRKEREFWVNEIFSNLGSATAYCCDLIEHIYEDSEV